MFEPDQVFDISVTLGSESIDYPGDTPFSRSQAMSLAAGDSYTLSRLSMSAHAGTHLDAPAHFLQHGQTIDEYPAGRFILPAKVIEIGQERVIGPEAFAEAQVNPGEALLFKTENSRTGLVTSGRFTDDFVRLSEAAAELCVAKEASLVGIDYITIDQAGDETFPIHHTFLSAGVLILESVNLAHVPPGTYTLVCLPLKIKDSEGGPTRAVLLAG